MTIDEAIKIFNTLLFFHRADCPKEEIDECIKMAIKALEQEDVLDKIRAEILDNRQWHMEHGQEDCAMLLDLEALAVIDKHRKGGAETVNAISIPKGATNGEIIQALFPNIDKVFSNVIDLNLWWNAPYKAESEVRNDE